MAKKRSVKSIGQNKILLMILILSFITVTFIAWITNMTLIGDYVTSIGLTTVAIVLLALMIPFIVRMAQSVKQGEPLDDERSRTVKTKAAAMSYYITLYWLLAIGFISDYYPTLTVSSATGLGILGMAISWGLTYLYYSRRL